MPCENVNQKAWRFCAAWIFAALLCIAAGSESAAALAKPDVIITPADLARAQAKASSANCPFLVLIVEAGNSHADDEACKAFESQSVLRMAAGKAHLAVIDLGVSRARATVTRFHPVQTPFLVCLSPRGIILDRAQNQINSGFISELMRLGEEKSPEIDRKLEALERAADDNKSDSSAQLALADFLMERNNAFEAIPVLEKVSHAQDFPNSLRIRAWADLARAHFWIMESEKGRHEAEDLIAQLGTANPEARAAANLVLGNQDAANAKRVERARQEFEEAIAATPESSYGKDAAAALAKLSKGSPSK